MKAGILEQELVEQIALAAKRREQCQLDYYEPYEFQRNFHNARGHESTAPAVQKALQAANQIGKTRCGAAEVAIHATGAYPTWWDGQRFERPVQILVAGQTNESTRDICQSELFGESADESRLGTGLVPKALIGKRNRKAGVPNAYDSVFVKHPRGWSKVFFRAYEQGWQKFMGIRIDFGWCDEEPPEDVWAQFIRATLSTKGFLAMTYTPENGVTKVVHQFMNDLKPGQALITATWDDAPHMTAERRAQSLAAMPAHQREMRSKGVPLMGSGLVFQVNEETVRIAQVHLSDWWPRICAIDLGMDHKFAAVWQAWDRDTDIVYTYDVYT
ncbi:MAG: terminase family protein, partial [Acidobacteria bacterium]|nr:terminase family protein [Acidobacteriota bacterium]